MINFDNNPFWEFFFRVIAPIVVVICFVLIFFHTFSEFLF